MKIYTKQELEDHGFHITEYFNRYGPVNENCRTTSNYTSNDYDIFIRAIKGLGNDDATFVYSAYLLRNGKDTKQSFCIDSSDGGDTSTVLWEVNSFEHMEKIEKAFADD